MKIPDNPSESFKRRNPLLFENQTVAVQLSDPSTSLAPSKSTDEEKLNKLEVAWLRELRLLFPAEAIGVQSITLKLGNDTRYTPDFWTVDVNGQLTFWETKGFFRDDAKVKIKIAARQFRYFRFVLVEKKKGEWIETPIKP